MKSVMSCSFWLSAALAALSLGELARAGDSPLAHDIRREGQVKLLLSYGGGMADPTVPFDVLKENWNLHHDTVRATVCVESSDSLPEPVLNGHKRSFVVGINPISPKGSSYGMAFIGRFDLAALEHRQCFVLNTCELWDIGYSNPTDLDGSVGRLDLRFFRTTENYGDTDQGQYDNIAIKANVTVTVRGTEFEQAATTVLPGNAAGYIANETKCTPLLGTGKHLMVPTFFVVKNRQPRMTCKKEGKQVGHLILPSSETSVAVSC